MTEQTDFSNDPSHRVGMAVYELRTTLDDLHKLAGDDQTSEHLLNELYDLNECFRSMGRLMSTVRRQAMVAAE